MNFGKPYSQNDHRWSRLNLGPSSLKMGGHGCTTTAIASGLTHFFQQKTETPGELARFLVYTDDNHPLGGGLIIWGQNRKQWAKLGIEWVGRYSYDPQRDYTKLREFAESPDYFVIIEVLRKDGGRHWLTLIGPSFTWRGKGWACMNPWKGNYEWKTVGLLAPYVRVIGWALFKRV